MSKHVLLRGLVVLVGFALAEGCGGSQGPAGDSNELYADGLWQPKGSDGKVEIHLSTYDGQCALAQAKSPKASSEILELSITPAAGKSSIEAGSYPIAVDDAPGKCSANIKVFDATCISTKVEAATGSCVLTTTLGSGDASGSFNLQLANGTTRVGAFTGAASCGDGSGGGPSCVH